MASPRTKEDVLETLSLSKLNVKDLSRPSQALYFTYDASDQNHMLIQLNKEILEEIIKGEEVVIRGNEGDSAVLCTADKTFDIKKAKISNTLLLVPECTIPPKRKSVASESEDDEKENEIDGRINLLHRKIQGWSHDYLEVKRIHPQTDRIKKLLAENLYQGPEKDKENEDKKKYTMSELLDRIQASEGELVKSLFKIGACYIDGYWRILDFGYIIDSFGEICNVIDSESWNVSKVPIKELCEKINDSGELVPNFIVRHLMSFYGSIDYADTIDTYFKLNEEKLCRFYAEMLLRDVGKFNLNEFLEVWEQSVPDGVKPDQKYLRGLAIIEKNTKPATIQHFSTESLSQDATERFDILFQTRPKWTREDIEPYVDDLCLEGQTVSALLTKYARSCVTDNVKLFCSRKSMR